MHIDVKDETPHTHAVATCGYRNLEYCFNMIPCSSDGVGEKKLIPYLTGCIGFRHDLRIVRDDFVVPFHDSGNLLVIIPVDLPAILLEHILHSPDPFKLGLVGRWFAVSALVAVPTSTRVRVKMLDTDKGVRSGRHLHDEIRALLGLDNLTEDLTCYYAPVLIRTAEVI